MGNPPLHDRSMTIQQLFAVEDGAPVPLELPCANPAHVHDDLPLGVYEAARTFERDRYVGLREHLDRMERSIELAGLDGPFDRAGLCGALDSVARRFPTDDAKVRFDFLAAPAAALGTRSHTLIQAIELSLPHPEVYEAGVACQLSELRRRRPEVKEASWVVERRAAEGGPENFESILGDDEGRLLEGVMSNFFWIKDGALRTTPVATVLPGITRCFVLGLAEELGLAPREEHARADGLDRLDEAFFTTSVRSVVPIVRIAGVELGDGRPGPVTRRMMDAYAELCARSAVRALDA